MERKLSSLLIRWILANAFAELFGLGGTFALMAVIMARLNQENLGGILLGFLVAVLSGAIEATLVGWAQWKAMHPWFQEIRFQSWWLGTLIGALLGYVLGYLPSTLMSMGESASQTVVSEPPQWVSLLLAAGLGLAAGAVLSVMQWRVLRQAQVQRAGLWVPANMLAWSLGMPIIFFGMDLAFIQYQTRQQVLIIAGALLAAGLVVGSVHGLFLVHLAKKRFGSTIDSAIHPRSQ